MRKSLFLTLVLSLCVVDCGAFAATTPSRGNSRGSQASAPVAARAASRQKVASGGSNGAGTARVASRQVATTPMVSVLSKKFIRKLIHLSLCLVHVVKNMIRFMVLK